MALVDLHTHSTASDGTDSPAGLVAQAVGMKLAAVALTDHDTVAGVAEARAAGSRLGIEVISGIEISTSLPGCPGEIHLLGHFIDPDSDALARMNAILLAARRERNARVVARLSELGVPVEPAELEAISDGIITRAHFAEVMLRRRYVRSVDDAFARYLGQDGRAYFPKGKLTVAQALDTIRHAGGLAALAHPVHLGLTADAELERLIGRLVELGLEGIEAFHPDHNPAWVRRGQLLARRFNLYITGGSDYHGVDRVPRPLNSQRVDDSFLATMRRRLGGRQAGSAASGG